MSLFALKLVAVLAMTIDHIGLVFGQQGWNLLPFSSSVLRTVGRISFPLFAYCLARGWHTTGNRQKYFQNLLCGAVASQIPFSMAFCSDNLAAGETNAYFFHFDGIYCLFAIVAVSSYWIFILNNKWKNSVLIAGVAAILPGIRLQIHGVWILGETGNVFYTFLAAFLCLYSLQVRDSLTRTKRIWLLLALPILLVGYGLPADYGTGLVGLALIVGLSILSTNRQQAIFLAMWSLLYYGVILRNPYSMLACAVSCGFVLLYDPKIPSRFRAKRFFYWYYPIHLFLLGGINVGLRFLG